MNDLITHPTTGEYTTTKFVFCQNQEIPELDYRLYDITIGQQYRIHHAFGTFFFIDNQGFVVRDPFQPANQESIPKLSSYYYFNNKFSECFEVKNIY